MEAAQVASEAAEPYAGAAEAEVDMQAAGNEESMPLPPPGSRPGPSRQTNRRSVGDSSQSALPRPDNKLGREAKHTFDYKPDHGNTSLKYHVEHYHKEDLRKSFTLSKILNKLKSCITWTKKSSKGWHTLVLACREMRVKAVKFITPVKTRFTSTWSMLRSLITARAVVDHLYGTMPQTASTNLRQRQPTHAEWSVAAAMEDVLSHPCKLVKLAQSNGSHWLLSDAFYSIAKLEAKYTEMRNQTVAISATRPGRADEDDDGEEHDLKTQSDAMIDPILSEVNNMMTPFRTFDHDRRHEVTADSEASSTVEARISCAEYVQSLLDDSAAIES
eukprot:jgi/Tetstr1/448336/TSEL_035620.t1